MSLEEYAKFANENPACYLATAEGDQPRVRAMGMWYADETGFYFQTQSNKALYKQIQENDKVEVYYCTPDFSRVMRVSGRVKTIEDKELRRKCIEDRPFIKDMGITDPEDPLLAVFHLFTGEAYFWTRADSMKEADIPREKF
jgi:pyridoxamine 5'-phosphate oxidase